MNYGRIFQQTSVMLKQFEHGYCHVCHQKNAKTRKLWCEKHNYCQSCAEFIPRLRHGDFTCQRCPEKGKADPFLASQTECETRKYKRSKHVIDSDDSDDNDLEGNNQNLDQLLESLIKPAVQDKPPSGKEKREEFKPIPRKLSFLHLSLPSANSDVTERTQSPKPNLICNTVTQILNSPQSNKLRSRRAESKSSSSTDSNHDSHSSSQRKGLYLNEFAPLPKEKVLLFKKFEPDPSELERNSSPCKGVRPRSCQSDFSDSSHHSTSSVSETEQLLELIGEIDGPDFPSSSSSRSGSVTSNKSYDAFWDAKFE
ncbi:uncharacterized protein LOC123545345 [Mercenaria mercenaria]|uniref:uncharacterized protein LOC123545345 n=1 Tax=Mercenaria mercenaria TaxID=6596 RepID=UPI00234F2A4A|nr:uncharacterized protein LOC123545345 [Mercenaria mercenaria]